MRERIAELEAEIEELRDSADRCRKIEGPAKFAVVLGILLLSATLLKLPATGPVAFVIAITAILGGVALKGSNESTRDNLMARIRVHEAQRAEMIDALELRACEFLR